MLLIEKQLTKRHISCRSDMSGVALGRKYARMDEIGCPFAATIDYDTVLPFLFLFLLIFSPR